MEAGGYLGFPEQAGVQVDQVFHSSLMMHRSQGQDSDSPTYSGFNSPGYWDPIIFGD